MQSVSTEIPAKIQSNETRLTSPNMSNNETCGTSSEFWPEQVLKRIENESPCVPTKEPGINLEGSDATRLMVREMLLDLRREVSYHAVSERQLIYRLMEAVQRLSAEVRELRYALLLGSSRRERKKGSKGARRLLSS